MLFGEIFAKIAIVEDDATQASLLESILTDAGYKCEVFNSGRHFVSTIHHQSFDLVILDLILQDTSTFYVLDYLSQLNHKIPIIVVSNLDDDITIVNSLERGADDYVTKPVNHLTLIARTKVVLRRHLQDYVISENIINIGGYRLDRTMNSLTLNGQSIKITYQEFALAWFLFSNPNRPHSRQYLLERLWGKLPDNQTRTIDTHIARLRAKLVLDGHAGVRLSSIYGYGYRLELVQAQAETLDESL